MNAEEIKNLRVSMRLTQEKFASVVGVSFTTLNRWEQGKARPMPLAREKLEKMAKKGKNYERSAICESGKAEDIGAIRSCTAIVDDKFTDIGEIPH